MSLDVLKLLQEQRATNRSEFASAQADRALVQASRPRQTTHLGRDADSGKLAIAQDSDDAQLNGSSITSGHIKRGQAVRVNADGSFVTVDQKQAARTQATETPLQSNAVGKVKLLFSIETADGTQLWLCGYQTDAVLAFTVPQGHQFVNASVDNLGAELWSLNVIYRVGSVYQYLKVSNGDAEDDWELMTADGAACCGYGFWIGNVLRQNHVTPTGSGTQISGNSQHGTVTVQGGSITVGYGGKAIKLWQGEESQQGLPVSQGVVSNYYNSIYDSSAITVDSAHDYNNYENGQESNPGWILPDLVLTSTLSRQTSFIEHAESHVVQEAGSNGQSDGVTVSIAGSTHDESGGQASQTLYSILKINQTGEAGLGSLYRFSSETFASATVTYSLSGALEGTPTNVFSFSSSNKLVWFTTAGVQAEAPDEFNSGGIIDVFEDYFTSLGIQDRSQSLNYAMAYLWDADATDTVYTYTDTFDHLEQSEVTIFKAVLEYADNQPPHYLGASYHP